MKTNERLPIASNRPAGAINGHRAWAATTARVAIGAFAVLLALLLAACDLDAEKQTILIKYDPARDVAHVRLIYEGIHADDAAAGLAELDRIVATGTIFYLPFDTFGRLRIDLAPPSVPESDSGLARAFRGRTTLTNGRFFLNGEGKLSAWQDLRLAPLGHVLATINAMMNDSGTRRDREGDASAGIEFWLDESGLGFFGTIPAKDLDVAADANGVIELAFSTGSADGPGLLASPSPGVPPATLPGPLDPEITTERLIEEFAAPAFGAEVDQPSAPRGCLEEDSGGSPFCA